MLFLLPPSETKAEGPYPGARESTLCIQDVALTFGGLNSARDQLADAVINLSSRPELAAEVFKLSPKRVQDLEHNSSIRTAPTMFALDRYTGTLFDAIHGRGLKGTPTEFAHLTGDQMLRTNESVLIQSALFGLIPAKARIPRYRLSANTKLVDKKGNRMDLPSIWAEAHDAVFHRMTGPIVDMRSKAYANLAPIPNDIEHYTLDVALRGADGVLRTMNHFNKKYKGELVRAVLLAKRSPTNLADLHKIAAAAGFELQQSANELLLIVAHA